RLTASGMSLAVAVPSKFAWSYRVDLNTAPIPELMTLPGIGRSRASAIILHRVRHGRFRAIEELLEIDGFGSSALQLIEGLVRDPCSTESPENVASDNVPYIDAARHGGRQGVGETRAPGGSGRRRGSDHGSQRGR
ncbi:MAG: helix-hairpin-helix domain-containing protein, partial [Planctomycetota bacterium]|nr:helix-hairpin-helix domain-containing protein [Planctomycetota bacterium]